MSLRIATDKLHTPTEMIATDQNNYVKAVVEGGRRYLDVEVPKHVRQYLLMEYGGQRQEFRPQLNGFMGGVLRMITEKLPYSRRQNKKFTRGAQLRVWLPDSLSYGTIRKEMVEALGLHLDAFFRQKFLAFVDGATTLGSSDHAAVKQFLEKYDINPDHWDLGTALKCWRDYKEMREKSRALQDFL